MTLSHGGASELGQLMEGTTAGALIPESGVVRMEVMSPAKQRL